MPFLFKYSVNIKSTFTTTRMTPSSTLLLTQFYSPTPFLIICITEIRSWFFSDFLYLNSDKTMVHLVVKKSSLSKKCSFVINDYSISPYPQVKSLGVFLNNTLSFQPHNVHLRNKNCLNLSAPQLWNSPPSNLRNTDSLLLFKSKLKSHLSP